MSEHESFEERLRALAEDFGRSMQRASEADLEELVDRLGFDAERVRSFADAAGHWLNDHMSGADAIFHQSPTDEPDDAGQSHEPDPEPQISPETASWAQPTRSGPHPLDLPTDEQGIALSALDSGRWDVGAGSNQLTGSGEGQSPLDRSDLVGELRARDWITAEGALTLVGRRALARWCGSGEESAGPSAS
jgi:hypothetical protein